MHKTSTSGRTRRRGLSLTLVLLGLLVVATFTGPTSGAATVTPTRYVGSGSDVTFHVMSALDLLYNQSPGCNVIAPSGTQPLDQRCIPAAGDVTTENYPHDIASEYYGIGGSAAINQLCTQNLPGVAPIDYARQTSGPAATTCHGLRYVAYGRDALSWEAFPDVPGSATANMNNQSGACAGSDGFCLTAAELQGIFVNCSITNWNQVGGANAPISVYTIYPQFGTRKAWDGFIGGSSSTCPSGVGSKLVDQTNNAQVAPADLATAIVPVSVGSWTERYAQNTVDGSDIGAIDGVRPTIPNIRNLSFPYSRSLFNVYCAGDPSNGNKCGTANPASAAVRAYIGENGWLCRATAHARDPITGVPYRTEIASTITRFGFAPLPLGPTGGGATTTNYCRLAVS